MNKLIRKGVIALSAAAFAILMGSGAMAATKSTDPATKFSNVQVCTQYVVSPVTVSVSSTEGVTLGTNGTATYRLSVSASAVDGKGYKYQGNTSYSQDSPILTGLESDGITLTVGARSQGSKALEWINLEFTFNNTVNANGTATVIFTGVKVDC